MALRGMAGRGKAGQGYKRQSLIGGCYLKVTITKSQLSQIPLLSGICSNRSPLPILSNLLIQADNHLITITATDLQVGAQLSIDADISIGDKSICANIEEPGAVCINGSKLAEIIKLLGDSNDTVVSLSGDYSRVHVSDFGGNTSFKLPALDPADFPAFPSSDQLEWKEESTSTIIKHYFRILYAASSDDSRFNLNGVFYTPYKDGHCLVATDGHRLALQRIDNYPFGDAKLLLPKYSADFIKKTLIGSKQSTCKLSTDSKQLFVSVGNLFVSARLLDGDFPDFTKVIADISSARKLTIIKDQLMSAVKRASLVTMDRSRGLLFSVSSQKGIVLSATTEIGSSEETMSTEYQGEPFDFVVNSVYLQDALNAIDGNTINMLYTGESKPITIEVDGVDDYFSIVMPMRK